MRASWCAALVLAALVPLSACGATTARTPRPATTGSSLPAPPASSSPGAPAPLPAPNRITLADGGRAITMHPGDRFLLALGEQQQWTVRVADTGILERVPNLLVVRGAQGVYRAVAVGTTTLEATGRPDCASGSACPMYLVDFRLTVDVRAA